MKCGEKLTDDIKATLGFREMARDCNPSTPFGFYFRVELGLVHLYADRQSLVPLVTGLLLPMPSTWTKKSFSVSHHVL